MVKKVKENKIVFVGISGGVDSAVAALILIQQGYEVVGVFIRTWSPDFIDCTWKNERREAMRVCAHLKIPFLECDAEKEYKEGVADYMISEYRKGKTPNPDVMCNREVKFGVFWQFAKKRGADFIATGHYVHKITEGDKFMLLKNPDEGKDQVYFLWTLNQEDLFHVIFPLGKIKKVEVRRLAKKFKLPNANKKDSQGVCFLGQLDMKKFLEHYIDLEPGDVLNSKGEIIGHHNGAFFFTIGERHGFIIDKKYKESGPLYVVSKDFNKNTITVSEHSPVIISKEDKNTIISCHNTNWINTVPENNKKYQAQIRYHGELIDCNVKTVKEDKISVLFNKQINIDSGQSMVFYDGDICLGGAVVD
ncbi:MAG: tRNA 2-thiouridine(34) synthase MnmA [Candidatus Moranbacteria bacterium]|nr:tRNA 2-thiouridine(34) synthase MnmA [Candidatus Moranbacteria bacterium]